MTMTPAQKRTFIENDLYYELRGLLGSATIWRATQVEQAGFNIVVAMDAAFLHARNLFNFLAAATKNDSSVTEFGVPAPYTSAVYSDWSGALHDHVVHVRPARLQPTNTVGGQHLNQQVEVFAREVLRLWILFESDPAASDFEPELRVAREQAIADSAEDAAGRITALF